MQNPLAIVECCLDMNLNYNRTDETQDTKRVEIFIQNQIENPKV